MHPKQREPTTYLFTLGRRERDEPCGAARLVPELYRSVSMATGASTRDESVHKVLLDGQSPFHKQRGLSFEL